uniref:C3H1-type domain-containing protein n=1 Tax=Caenorhabditis tropicalis TaxID=1561998 RepID=A0A1I7UGL8_9PELO
MPQKPLESSFDFPVPGAHSSTESPGTSNENIHLRYYKTAHCTYPNDARGQCSKNGVHCAFAHTPKDKRTATIARAPFSDKSDSFLAFDGREKEIVSFSTDDPKWSMSNHDQVLSCYKTEQCQKPARLCRQGYACPYYHNSKDRRRPPGTYRYRSTPCPAARTIDEWLDPDLCESADNCQYCHTRTEQQFHPEIYKSTKCNDMLENGFCPRSVFCAFAHHDSELHEQRNPYSSKPSPVSQCSPNGRRSSGNGCPSYEPPMSSSFPNGPPGLERPSIGFEFQEEDPRLRAQTINMGHLDMLKRNMLIAGNWQMGQGQMNHPSNVSLYTNDSGQGGPSMETLDQLNMENIHEKCHFLEQALDHERRMCDMWRMRYEGEYAEKGRLQAQVEQMRHMLRPLAVRMPEEEYARIPEESYSIRPSASLPHSPSYNIFQENEKKGQTKVRESDP